MTGAKTETLHAYHGYADRVNSDSKTINGMIASIKKRNSDLRRDVAVAAASCVFHAIEHGNVTLCTNLVNALEGWRREALHEWFIMFGPVMWNESAETFGLDRDKRAYLQTKMVTKDSRMALARDMVTKPFWEWKPEQKFKPFDLAALLLKAIKTGTKQDQSDPRHKGLDKLDALKAFIVETFKDDGNTPTPNVEATTDEVANENVKIAA